MTVIVDTNVILVANGQHETVSGNCVIACVQRLDEIRKRGCVAVDDGHRILSEYLNKTTPRIGKRAGDAFVKWLLQNKASLLRCAQVKIHEHDERGFESFPNDSRLENFDKSDRKFIAVAVAHGETPPILQASDSKWIGWAPALQDHGIEVEFLCRDDIRSFDGKKRARKAKK